MQNFVDYYSNFLARRLVRQNKIAARQKKNTAAPKNDDRSIIIPAEHSNSDLFSYSVFFNKGSGCQSAEEINNRDESYIRRWLTFYQPDAKALPQHQNIQQLQQQCDTLNQQRAKLHTPLLAGLMISVIIATLLTLKGNFWLLLMPVALLGFIWTKTHPAIDSHSAQLQLSTLKLTQQRDLLTGLTHQASQYTNKESLHVLRKNYTECLEKFLADSIREYMPELTPIEISEKIHAGQMQLYTLESRGILQIPALLQRQEERILALDTLVRKTGQGWCAVQPYEELHGLTRLHYFFGVIRFEQNVILCSAFYDWVGNTLYAEQRDCCSYQNILHIRQFETALPTDNKLAEEFSDEVYQLHFGNNVEVIDISMRGGEHFYCALPVGQPVRKTTIDNLPNTPLCQHLRHNHRELVADLSQRIEAHRADAVTA